ncbi:uncharacterized protein LOC106133758 isoform X1 [Amyelois transitella]|uniref:uncharacterized protein LOC106133758 isoform X1 n=1 Tax=Amyelois transitella TaxID=680683 RepID=UPI00298FDC83|nr:uncharacterized protein LOC106133758 isoform X1 [Amyelois transitella]
MKQQRNIIFNRTYRDIFFKFQAVGVGEFFWKPRLGLDLSIPTTESTVEVIKPTKENIKAGLVTLIDGYQAGISFIAIVAGVTSARTNFHLNPISAYFYTNVYRWGLRYFSLVPAWLSGHGGNFVETTKVWKRRFYYMDEFLPKWARYMFPYVKQAEWEQEQKEFKKFKKHAESAFGKHYVFPTKVFNNFLSQETKETLEDVDISSISISGEKKPDPVSK